MTSRWILFTTVAAGLGLGPGGASEERPFRGFASDASAPQARLEARFRATIQPEKLRETLRVLTENPHHAGGEGSKAVAQYVLAQFKSWGLDAWIEEQEALMPMPTERLLELIEPEAFQARLKEPALVEDKDSSDDGQLPTFNAYSADGDVTAQLVYVNYGVPEDYDALKRLDHGMTHSLYIHDPNGYGVELLYELPREVWEGDIDAALNFAEQLPTEGADALQDRTDVPVFKGNQPASA